jgi:hypothetical protein
MKAARSSSAISDARVPPYFFEQRQGGIATLFLHESRKDLNDVIQRRQVRNLGVARARALWFLAGSLVLVLAGSLVLVLVGSLSSELTRASRAVAILSNFASIVIMLPPFECNKPIGDRSAVFGGCSPFLRLWLFIPRLFRFVNQRLQLFCKCWLLIEKIEI